MFQRISNYFLALVVTIALTACASPGMQSGETEIRAGVIEQITFVQLKSNHHKGVGAVIGGLAGLGIGSLIGGGNGRDVAMVLGTVGGAFAGNEIQKNNDQPVPGQQIIVRTNSGVLVSVTQPVNATLYKGQKVYIEGNGDGTQVIPR